MISMVPGYSKIPRFDGFGLVPMPLVRPISLPTPSAAPVLPISQGAMNAAAAEATANNSPTAAAVLNGLASGALAVAAAPAPAPLPVPQSGLAAMVENAVVFGGVPLCGYILLTKKGPSSLLAGLLGAGIAYLYWQSGDWAG